MITEINAIKNEKDRELYVQFRNILDNYFVTQVLLHDEKDHRFHECEAIVDLMDGLEEMFPKRMKEEKKISGCSEMEVLEDWLSHNESQFLMYLCSLVHLRKQLQKRTV